MDCPLSKQFCADHCRVLCYSGISLYRNAFREVVTPLHLNVLCECLCYVHDDYFSYYTCNPSKSDCKEVIGLAADGADQFLYLTRGSDGSISAHTRHISNNSEETLGQISELPKYNIIITVYFIILKLHCTKHFLLLPILHQRYKRV